MQVSSISSRGGYFFIVTVVVAALVVPKLSCVLNATIITAIFGVGLSWLGTIQTPSFLSLNYRRAHPVVISRSSRGIHDSRRESLPLGRRFGLVGTSITLSFLLTGSAVVAAAATRRRGVVRRLGWSVRLPF